MRRRPSRIAPRGGFRRAAGLLLGSIVWPGTAQFLSGNRRVGQVAMIAWIAVATAAIVMWLRLRPSLADLIGWATNADVLDVSRWVVIAGFAAWLLLFIDAWRLCMFGAMNWWRSAIVSVCAILVVSVTTAATAQGVRTVSATKDSVEEVFTQTKKTSPLKGRYNILLIGSDSGKDRTGLRPDSMHIASINARNGRTVLISLPRNLQNFPFAEDSPMRQVYPYGFNCGDECLLNAVHTMTADRQDLYPDAADPGLEATIDAVEGITGLKINYHVMVNMKGFASLVDAVGGVEMEIDSPIAMFGKEDSWKNVYIQPGKKKLNGNEALWYGRSRVQSDDYHRMGRQKCLLQAMLKQLSPQQVILNATKIASSASEMLTTDIPASELGAFGDLAVKAQKRAIPALSVVPPEYSTVNPNIEQIQQDIQALVSPKKAKEQQQQAATPTPDTTMQTPAATDPNDEDDTEKSDTAANNTDDLAASC